MKEKALHYDKRRTKRHCNIPNRKCQNHVGRGSAGDYEDFLTHDKDTVDWLFPRSVEFISQIAAMVEEWLKNM
ncbi:MAG: hypothetical protein IKP99_07190 [Bacteroidales bacterium]|nr:hypothetical protein [Bacteroidales bacterium]MBR6265206.1 hypothetical protein [Bacteroidales bacterium]